MVLVRSVLVAFSLLNHLSADVPGAWHSKVGFHGCVGQSPIIKIIYCTCHYRFTCMYIYIYAYLKFYHTHIYIYSICLMDDD